MLELTPVFGVFFVLFILATAWAGVATLLTLYPLILIAPSLWRKWRDWLVGMWLKMPTSLLEIAGVKFVFTGDQVDRNDPVMMISNHRNRLDWLFLWAWFLRYGRASHEKIVLKAPIRMFFAPGWATQLLNYMFLNRKWEEDKKYVSDWLDYHLAIKYPLQLLLFPEGTDLSPKNLMRSHEFSEKYNLPKYNYVMHPRTTGFAYIFMRLRNRIKYVYDVTIAYPDGIPQGEKQLVMGSFPREIHIHLKAYLASDLPTDEEEIGRWCKDRFEEKEKALATLYERANEAKKEGKPIPSFGPPIKDPPGTRLKVYGAFLFWVALLAACVYALSVSSWCRWYFLAYNVTVLVLNLGFKVTFDQIETQLGLLQNGVRKRS